MKAFILFRCDVFCSTDQRLISRKTECLHASSFSHHNVRHSSYKVLLRICTYLEFDCVTNLNEEWMRWIIYRPPTSSCSMFTYKNINLTNNDVRLKKENVRCYFVKIFPPDISFIYSIVPTIMSSIITNSMWSLNLKLISYH